MIKVKASLSFKNDAKMPTDVIFDIPESECNRNNWNTYIKERLMTIFNDRVKVEYELM